MIEKTAGTGTSTILVNGTLSNTGTIEADSGTLSLAATIAQVSASTLTAGTWNAEAGSTLVSQRDQHHDQRGEHHARRRRRDHRRDLGPDDQQRQLLAHQTGPALSTAGDFSNTGSLTIGAGSTLTVNGNYSQGSAASLTIGIGGAASGNEYGQLDVTGSATLAGSVNASTASGFSPAAGNSYPIVTYASETGGTASRSPA